MLGETEPTPVVLLGSLTQNGRRHRRNVAHRDPAHATIPPVERQLTRSGSTEVQQIIHEHVGMEVGPGQAARLDVALDELMPGEVGVGAVPFGKNTDMDDVLHTRLLRGIHQGLALRQHRHRVAGQQEDAVHTGQGQGKCARVIQVQMNGLFSLPTEPLHFLRTPGTETNANVLGLFEFLDHQLAYLA